MAALEAKLSLVDLPQVQRLVFEAQMAAQLLEGEETETVKAAREGLESALANLPQPEE